MAKLIALTPINHDGKPFAEGDTFDVTDKAQVAQLLESGAASLKSGNSKPKAEASTETDPAQVAQAAQAAEAAALANVAVDAEAAALAAALAAQNELSL